MSGRLIILPKKSYCPWAPQNIERVLRDEKQHAEEEKRRQQSESSKVRIQALKQGKERKPQREATKLTFDEC